MSAHNQHSVQVLWDEIRRAYSGEVIPYEVGQAHAEVVRLVEQLEAGEKLAAAALEDLDRICDWPHVKLYGGQETAYMPLIVHEWARSAREHLRYASTPASRPD